MGDTTGCGDGGIEIAGDVGVDTKAVREESGENVIVPILSRLGDGYAIFNDIVIADRFNDETKLNHLVVGRNGIFVIETRKLTGTIKGTRSSYKWIEVIGDKEHILTNPISQNYYNVSVLRNILHSIESTKLKYYSIITFTGDAQPPCIEQTDFRFVPKDYLVEYIKGVPDEISQRYADAIVEMVQYSIINKEYSQD